MSGRVGAQALGVRAQRLESQIEGIKAIAAQLGQDLLDLQTENGRLKARISVLEASEANLPSDPRV